MTNTLGDHADGRAAGAGQRDVKRLPRAYAAGTAVRLPGTICGW
ncbi:MAG: hypothetical protein QOH72_4040 [Solirubrobacteraceae bacterium]|jgi:hypothetical protein|nr:hypothetical protein [Solirubrobacteraceae bacterium]